MKPLIECVPNFSEGRRPRVVQTIVAAMRDVTGVHILDVQSDADHNRSVVTMVGSPMAVRAAMFQGIRAAAEHIDMDLQEGEHPRLGATDVVPFIPIHGVTLDECVALAHDLGRQVGDELGIPVYFYEAAATRADRVNLEDVRRGEYEALKREIGVNPKRVPDHGPQSLGKAGATIIGARPFLIAFNAYLNTNDINIARNIARAIRHSNGGFRYLKALGLLVAGQAQVSMNFTDFNNTPLYRVVEAIRREAARYGTTITHTELIGLTPEKALIDAAQWYLQLDRFSPDQILEHKLSALDEGVPMAFLEAVASKAPTPGGGSVAALAAALGSALTAMVGRVTVGKRRYAAVSEEVAKLIIEAERLRGTLVLRVEEDAAVFNAVLAARRALRKADASVNKDATDTKATLANAYQDALIQATEISLMIARDALAVMSLALDMVLKGNRNAATDAATAAWMAMASVKATLLNARANSTAVKAVPLKQQWRDQIAEIDARAQSILTRVQQAVMERIAG